MLGSLRRRRDLIVVDNRGTGRSGAINCPRLQAGKGLYSREVARCARRLGARANAYGTGAASDDLAAVLDKLDVRSWTSTATRMGPTSPRPSP
jgi:pimeloyl-ACP methyl ester carboxylesterase